MNTIQPPRPAAGVTAALRDPSVLMLGVTQTVGYGSLYYAHGIIAPHVSAYFGMRADLFFGLLSAGLLLGGLAAPAAGRAMDRLGAAKVLASGSVLAAIALLAAALAPNLPVFAGAILVMELASCMVLYEAAFAWLAQQHGQAARPRITAITLIAGFASTVFWPLTQYLAQTLDWRGALGIYAAVHLLVCLPLHLRLAKKAQATSASGTGGNGADAKPALCLSGRARQRAFALYGIAICASGLVYSALPIHLISIISSKGFSAETAALVAMVMGPSQVLARLVEVSFGHRFDALMTGKVALGGLVAALLLLILPLEAPVAMMLFTSLYGVSQGLITIARGTVPLQLFGPVGYASLVGRITGWRFFINAFSPYLFAVLMTYFGIWTANSVLLVVAVVALAAYLLLRRPSAEVG